MLLTKVVALYSILKYFFVVVNLHAFDISSRYLELKLWYFFVVVNLHAFDKSSTLYLMV